MLHTVIVVFAPSRQYEFKFLDSDLDGLTREEARKWLEQEFVELDAVPANPMGKILILDRILGVAKYAGERRFSEGTEWANKYARCVALALGRDTIRVDVAANVVG